MADETRKRQALARLRESYAEARVLVSREEPYANLEWILGSKSHRVRFPVDLDLRMIEVIALWMQDLASELDRRLPSRPEARDDERLQRVFRMRHSMGTRLRAATEGFVIAFRRPGLTR